MLLTFLQNLWMLGRPKGGHFGFDEKRRDERWKKEKESEEGRKRLLREAIAGLDPVEQKKAEVINIPMAAVTVERFEAAMRAIEKLDDDDEIVAMIALGVL